MYRIAVVGATGYTGLELLRLLLQHPNIKIEALFSTTYAGRRVTDVFPHLEGLEYLYFVPFDPDNPPDVELIFLAVPHGQSHLYMSKLLKYKFKIIDLSADFRLKDLTCYASFYTQHSSPSIINQSVYGFSEFYESDIKKTQLCANPGCYATSVIAGLKPLTELGLISGNVIVDSKSGVSGAGRIPKESSLFCEVSGSFSAYHTGVHRHVPEMEQETGLSIFFSPHLVPMSRGILSTIYLNKLLTNQDIKEAFLQAYQSKSFIKLYEQKPISTKYVTGSNHIVIGWQSFPEKENTVIFVALDNLMKGASGQAIQNMNIMFNLDQQLGLSHRPLFV